MTAYYNDNDPYCVAWLRNLIAEGIIPAGDVDGRSIKDVSADDVRGYDQVHCFAGLGGWAYALRLASWPDDAPIWTGSCPCQPFSNAGKGAGFDDERDLWPEWFRIIRERYPAIVLGEQTPNALGWFDRAADDMESEDYACGAADMPAYAVAAPHIRQRLWFVSYAGSTGLSFSQRQAVQAARRRQEGRAATELRRWPAEPAIRGVVDGIPGFVVGLRAQNFDQAEEEVRRYAASTQIGVTEALRAVRGDDASQALWRTSGGLQRVCSAAVLFAFVRELARRYEPPGCICAGAEIPQSEMRVVRLSDALAGPSSGLQSLQQSPEQSANTMHPLSYVLAQHAMAAWDQYVATNATARISGGFLPARVPQLRALGNAIVPQVAAEFIKVVMEVT